MIKVKVNWNGAKVLEQIKARSWEGLQRAVVYYWNAVVDALNTDAGRVRKKKVRGKGGYTGGYTIYTNPGTPPGPPHKRTGWLQRNVKYALDKQTGEGHVGVTANAKYGLFLELGTRRMAALSFMMLTLKRVLPRLQALAGGRYA